MIHPLLSKMLLGTALAILLVMTQLTMVVTSLVAAEVAPPKPFGALPTPQHLQWHKLEFYGFIHFTLNTFTNKEWGGGDESPELFNPTSLDADQPQRSPRGP